MQRATTVSKQLAQKVALAEAAVAILREGRMVRNLAVEPQPAEME
jgi:DNA-binding Xre family transcriptional regulator